MFIAVDVSSKDNIEKLQHKLQISAGWNTLLLKPVSKQSFHFTLIFLGEVTINTVDKIKTNLNQLKLPIPVLVVFQIQMLLE